MVQLRSSSKKDSTLTNTVNCVTWDCLLPKWHVKQMRPTRWNACWNTPWQSGQNTDQMESLLEYALATSNLLSEPRSDGEGITIPNTFEEAMETPQAAKWKEASDREMASLEKPEIFELVSSAPVPSEKVIETKWVFKVKADHALKGRVVVQGEGQVPGIICGHTYAPMCRIQSIWMALAIAAHENWEVL